MRAKPLAAAPSRVIIEGVEPEIDAGRFPAKRTIGDEVTIEADIFADGHDLLGARLRYRKANAAEWRETPMTPVPKDKNDRWQGSFTVGELGFYEFTLEAWVDHFASWRDALVKKTDARQEVGSELLEGAEIIRRAGARASGADADFIRKAAERIAGSAPQAERVELALDAELAAAMDRNPDRNRSTAYPRVLQIEVERERARFGAWYEMFPRSASPDPSRHGTFSDVEARLPYVAGMGFDVLYLPPIHPIGTTHRKGPNNAPKAKPGEPGSPWGIGSPEGGHTAVHPDLGTLADFDRLVEKAKDAGLEIALDIAYQCSPDHPWVKEHPEWFRHRPDGTIHYAENPPKKYQDIYPLDFDCADWQALWHALLGVILFWVGHGVKIFRVDNPHTKPLAFWEWMIGEVRGRHPDVVFLAEAFTRPKIMRHLAKSGFSQSYSYFTWRNTKEELVEYFTELNQTESRWMMRPNLFANTPDIFHEYLQLGGRPAFQIRVILAATLGASYGIYGPPFELAESDATPGTEDYVGSEKYQQRTWDLDRPGNLRALITRLNRIRKENPALHLDERVRFHPVENDQLLFYSKTSPDLENALLIVVNLDPHNAQTGWVEVPLERLGLEPDDTYEVHDLLGDARYQWHGSRNYVALDPHAIPAHILRVRRPQRAPVARA